MLEKNNRRRSRRNKLCQPRIQRLLDYFHWRSYVCVCHPLHAICQPIRRSFKGSVHVCCSTIAWRGRRFAAVLFPSRAKERGTTTTTAIKCRRDRDQQTVRGGEVSYLFSLPCPRSSRAMDPFRWRGIVVWRQWKTRRFAGRNVHSVIGKCWMYEVCRESFRPVTVTAHRNVPTTFGIRT